MGNIVFICDTEEGHILPSFGLALSLQQRGHHIIYLGTCDNEELVTAQGFSFYPILQELLPKGSRQKIKQSSMPPDWQGDKEENHRRKLELDRSLFNIQQIHLEYFINGKYDAFIRETEPDVVLVSIFLPLEALILYYKYKICPIILTPHLKEPGWSIHDKCISYLQNISQEARNMLVDLSTKSGVHFESFKEIIAPLSTLRELVLCPHELYVGEPFMTPDITYVEPSIRRGELHSDVYSFYGVPPGKKIIYASLGSQAIRHGISCDHFYTKVVDVIRCAEFIDLHLIISVDEEFDKGKIGLAGKNVTIVSWASQIDILRVASVAIIHGGLGSVKECIYYGVPMIVFPLGYDQPKNAKCVAHHKLGYADNIDTISLTVLKSYILNALYDEDIKMAIQKMKIIFQEREKEQPGANIIEQLIGINKKMPDRQPSKL